MISVFTGTVSVVDLLYNKFTAETVPEGLMSFVYILRKSIEVKDLLCGKNQF